MVHHNLYKNGDNEIARHLKLHLFSFGLNELENIREGIECEQKYIYWWMSGYEPWNSPEVRKFKLYPEIEPSCIPLTK